MLWTILPTARINSHGRAPHIWSLNFIQSTLTISKLLLKISYLQSLYAGRKPQREKSDLKYQHTNHLGNSGPQNSSYGQDQMVEETPFTAGSYLAAYHKPQSKRCSLLATLQSTDYNVAECSFHWYDFYSTRISGCVMANQPAMKLREGTVYKVKFYVFLPENLEAGVAS